MLCYTQDDTNTEGNHVSLSFFLSFCVTHSYYICISFLVSLFLSHSLCLSFISIHHYTFQPPPTPSTPPPSLRFISVASINKAHVHYRDITIRSRDEHIVRQRPFVVARCHFWIELALSLYRVVD